MHHLVDPFRIRYPDAADFTYAPFGLLRKTRSRLDFFPNFGGSNRKQLSGGKYAREVM
jgi:hypothetical protein